MDILNKIGSWADKLTQIGVSVIALGVVLEVLFSGAGIPFWPNISVVDNIMAILGSLNAEGLLGLVRAFVLYHNLKKKGGVQYLYPHREVRVFYVNLNLQYEIRSNKI